MSSHPPLLPGLFYHIVSRGINKDQIFRTESDYRTFLEKYAHHVNPVMDTFAYCLMGNHFHFLVRVKTETEIRGEIQEVTPKIASKAISNCLNAYAKYFNRCHNRTGSLFERPFKRIPISDEAHLLTVIPYIHRNPQTHGFVDDFHDWPWTSYGNLITSTPTTLQRQECLDWFQGKKAFQHSHLTEPEPAGPYPIFI